MNHTKKGLKTYAIYRRTLAGAAIIFLLGTLAYASLSNTQDTPGARPDGAAAARLLATAALTPAVQEIGRITLSIDGEGTLNATAPVDVQKPAGATVRGAYLVAATTGFSGASLANGDVKINGLDVTWSDSLANSIGSNNYFANVTSIVKPIVDAAPAGIVSLTITEVNSAAVDGVILAVIFDDPAQPGVNSVILLFGAQSTGGDTFVITTSPLDPTKQMDMSLGISFGFQGTAQASIIDVNGQRLTSAAGGQDDGTGANGALLTVGGLGDSIANPANPLAGPTGDPRVDDELYDLRPFVTAGATSLTVFTQNPSNDDNILFGAFFFKDTTAVIDPQTPAFDICLQDDSNPNTVLLFNSQTGAYQFCCNGTSYTGTGTVIKKGGIFTLEHNGPTRRVLGKVDTAVGRGTAGLQSPPGTIQCTITDRNITNNTCVCTASN